MSWEYVENNLELVGGLGDGGGYDWSVLNVYKAEDGNYYWYEGSGCSCNSLEDDISSTSDMTPLNASTWNEFSTAVMGWDGGWGSTSGSDKAQLLASMSNLIPRIVPHA